MNNQGTPQPINEIFASTLFGINVNEHVNDTSRTKTTKKPRLLLNTNIPRTRNERVMFENELPKLQPVSAIYPYIDAKAFKMTMDNARLEIALYNERIFDNNLEIEKYNNQVKTMSLSKVYEPIQKQFIDNFIKSNKNLNPKLYNQKVENLKIEKGFLIAKMKFQKIKYATEQVLQNLLHDYANQIAKYTSLHIQLGSTAKQKIRAMEINSCKITNLQRTINNQNIYSIDVCKATIRNHRARLEEAGILIEYLFRGKEKGIKMHLNPKILVVFDAKTQKYECADNQFFKPDSLKKFTEIKDTTRTFITINKTKNDESFSKKLGTASPILLSSFYPNTPKQDEKSELGAAAESVKVLTISDKFKNLNYSNTNLSERLAAGEFYNYNRIDKRHFDKEVYAGTLTRPELSEILIQEILKSLSKIYRNSTPFVGSWKKAETMLHEKLFSVNNGNGNFFVNKELMVDIFEEWQWRINKAHRWFLKTGIRPLNPHDYLDFTRTDKKEIGFAYTKKAWNLHQKELENKPKQAKKLQKEAQIRKTNISNDKKFNLKLNSFFANRINLDTLIQYVDENLPKQFTDKLSATILKLSTKYTC